MAEGLNEEMSWSGLGVGTDKSAFLDVITERVPELDAEEAAEAVFCVLSKRISGGTLQRLVAQLPEDVRSLVGRCHAHRDETSNAEAGDRDDFYLEVAEHLMIEPEDVRRVLHGVFGGLHSQITEAQSERVSQELPRDIASTWEGARKRVPAPH